MSQVPFWFDRKFEFSFPVDLLPNLQARLRGTPARLEEMLLGRSHGVLIGKPHDKRSAGSILKDAYGYPKEQMLKKNSVRMPCDHRYGRS
jgi:hypothetical protein